MQELNVTIIDVDEATPDDYETTTTAGPEDGVSNTLLIGVGVAAGVLLFIVLFAIIGIAARLRRKNSAVNDRTCKSLQTIFTAIYSLH